MAGGAKTIRNSKATACMSCDIEIPIVFAPAVWRRLTLHVEATFLSFKADFQSSHEAPRSSLRVHA